MADLISRIYSNFRGVDFRGEEINLVRSPDSLNVWKDYKETESIRTRPGMKMHIETGLRVFGIHFYNGELILHGETLLVKDAESIETTKPLWWMEAAPSQSFVYDNILYIKDGKNYIQYDGNACSKVVGYVPTTSISRKPMGGGTKYEDVNMLSDYRKNSFLADGGSFDFFLDVVNIDSDFVPVVTYNDEVVPVDDYMVDYAEGKITFKNYAPDAPNTDGQDNIVIEFKKAVPKYKNAILNCTLLQVFDNRVFFSGNKDFPNYVWHCSLNDPSYVSD